MKTATFVANGQGKVDGVLFPHGQPIEVDDDTARRLENDPNYQIHETKPDKKRAGFDAHVQTDEEVTHDGDGSV